MKIIEFPKQGVTVTIPKQVVYKNVYVEKKLNLPEDDPSNQASDIIKAVINIGFFVFNDNGKEYIEDLNPPAILRIRYDDKIVTEAKNKNKTEDQLKFGWWDGNKWVYEDKDKTKKSKHKFKNKDWLGYGDLKTKGWPEDPPVGWGC